MNKFVKRIFKEVGSKLASLFKPGKTSKYKNHKSKLAKTLIKTAVANETIEERASKQNKPSADTMLRQLHCNEKYLDIIDSENVRIINSLKRKKLLPNIPKIAIDFTDSAYYGRSNSFEIIGSNQVDGTNSVIRKAVLSLAERGKSFILACKRVFQTERKTDILNYLIAKANKFFKNLGLILVDRGFFAIEVIKWFIAKDLRFLMLAIRNKRVSKLIKQFDEGKIPQIIDYSMGDVALKMFFVKKVIDGEQRILAFVTNLDNFVPELLASEYPNRWLIETAHREVEKFMIRTTSNDMALRHFFHLLACLIYNLWIYCRLTVQDQYGIKLRSYTFKLLVIDILFEDFWRTTIFLLTSSFKSIER